MPRPHEALRMSGSGMVWIAAPTDVVYAAVTDLRRMGEWSPENLGGDWIQGEGVIGATFCGRNRGPYGEWETIVTVTEAVPLCRFTFTVARPGEVGTAWCYDFRSEHGGTTLTESFEWHWTPLPDEGFRGRVGRAPIDEAARMVSERERHLHEQVDRTLAALKRALEADANASEAST